MSGSSKTTQKPLANRHWGNCRICAAYWVARVSLNLIAAAARGIGPMFPLLVVVLVALLIGKVTQALIFGL